MTTRLWGFPVGLRVTRFLPRFAGLMIIHTDGGNAFSHSPGSWESAFASPNVELQATQNVCYIWVSLPRFRRFRENGSDLEEDFSEVRYIKQRPNNSKYTQFGGCVDTVVTGIVSLMLKDPKR